MPSLSEADTRRKFVVPALQSAGWDDDPHSIAEQRTITDGRIVAELDALQTEVDGLKRLRAKSADELDVLLPAILGSCNARSGYGHAI